MEAVIPGPREARESVFLSALVTRFGAVEPTRHRVRNLSASGACIDQADVLRQGQTIVVDVGQLAEVGATVRWVKEGLAGLRFAQQIHMNAAKTRAKPVHVQQGWRPLQVPPGDRVFSRRAAALAP